MQRVNGLRPKFFSNHQPTVSNQPGLAAEYWLLNTETFRAKRGGLLPGLGARPPDALAVDVDPIAVREFEERVDPRQEAEVEDSGRQVGPETAFGRSVSVFSSQRPAASETGC